MSAKSERAQFGDASGGHRLHLLIHLAWTAVLAVLAVAFVLYIATSSENDPIAGETKAISVGNRIRA